jgi:transposase
MISLPSSVRVFLHAPPTDLRKGFDALCGLVTTAFGQDPTSGHLFLFVNRRRDRMKILYWDRDGLAIWYKRLETPGTFQIPATVAEAASIEMTPTQLSLILSGIDLKSAQQRKRYQRSAPAA